jgi:hypothetical protein
MKKPGHSWLYVALKRNIDCMMAHAILVFLISKATFLDHVDQQATTQDRERARFGLSGNSRRPFLAAR